MKKQLLILAVALFALTSCSKYISQYDGKKYYDYERGLEVRTIQAIGTHFFLEVLVLLPTHNGDTVKQWVPIEKYEKNKDKYIKPERTIDVKPEPKKNHYIRPVGPEPPARVWASKTE